MKIAKILRVGLLAFSVGAFAQTAQAAPITAVWNGYLYTGYDTIGHDLSGLSVEMSFTYDSDAASAANVYDNGYYREFYAFGDPLFYSSAHVALGNGESFSMTTPADSSYLWLGDTAHYYGDLYESEVVNGGSYIYAYYYNFTGGVTTTDPATTFAHTLGGGDYGGIFFNVADAGSGVSYYGYAYTGLGAVTTLNVGGVPAPGALALLGLGLIGFGAARRKKMA